MKTIMKFPTYTPYKRLEFRTISSMHQKLELCISSGVCGVVQSRMGILTGLYHVLQVFHMASSQLPYIQKLKEKNDNLNLRVTFIDDESEAILRVGDFRELGYEYLNYIGDGKFIRCDCCKRLVRKKSKHDGVTKYCNECKYKKQLEWSKRTYHNSKKNQNLS